MPTPKTRSHPRFRFDVATAKAGLELEDQLPLPAPVAAIGGGVAAAIAGWLLVTVVVMIAWLGSRFGFDQMLTFATNLWLLSQGRALTGEALRISVIPLGVSLVLAGLVWWAGGLAYRRSAQPRWRAVAVAAVQVWLGYVFAALVITFAVGQEPGSALIGFSAVSLPAAAAGAAWKAGYRRVGGAWLRGVVRGGLAGLAALAAVAAIVVAVAMIQGESRIATIENALGFDAAASLVWALACLAYLPDLLGWAAAWLLGTGFTVGEGSLVAPWVTRLGLLPTIPFFGALPDDGVGGFTGWLAAGAVPGLIAGVVATRTAAMSAPRAVSAGLGAGLLAAAGYLVWALLSRGALGSDRFSDVGPRLSYIGLGVGIFAVSATVAALVAWLLDRRIGSAG